MGEDLVTLVRRYCDKKLPVHLVKQVARQILLGLDYLHRSCKVVHTGQWFHFTNSAYLPSYVAL
jgi:serine/threonine-protein kinase SRPK3